MFSADEARRRAINRRSKPQRKPRLDSDDEEGDAEEPQRKKRQRKKTKHQNSEEDEEEENRSDKSRGSKACRRKAAKESDDESEEDAPKMKKQGKAVSKQEKVEQKKEKRGNVNGKGGMKDKGGEKERKKKNGKLSRCSNVWALSVYSFTDHWQAGEAVGGHTHRIHDVHYLWLTLNVTCSHTLLMYSQKSTRDEMFRIEEWMTMTILKATEERGLDAV